MTLLHSIEDLTAAKAIYIGGYDIYILLDGETAEDVHAAHYEPAAAPNDYYIYIDGVRYFFQYRRYRQHRGI